MGKGADLRSQKRILNSPLVKYMTLKTNQLSRELSIAQTVFDPTNVNIYKNSAYGTGLQFDKYFVETNGMLIRINPDDEHHKLIAAMCEFYHCPVVTEFDQLEEKEYYYCISLKKYKKGNLEVIIRQHKKLFKRHLLSNNTGSFSALGEDFFDRFALFGPIPRPNFQMFLEGKINASTKATKSRKSK